MCVCVCVCVYTSPSSFRPPSFYLCPLPVSSISCEVYFFSISIFVPLVALIHEAPEEPSFPFFLRSLKSYPQSLPSLPITPSQTHGLFFSNIYMCMCIINYAYINVFSWGFALWKMAHIPTGLFPTSWRIYKVYLRAFNMSGVILDAQQLSTLIQHPFGLVLLSHLGLALRIHNHSSLLICWLFQACHWNVCFLLPAPAVTDFKSAHPGAMS